jgi:hypothetical protein
VSASSDICPQAAGTHNVCLPDLVVWPGHARWLLISFWCPQRSSDIAGHIAVVGWDEKVCWHRHHRALPWKQPAEQSLISLYILCDGSNIGSPELYHCLFWEPHETDTLCGQNAIYTNSARTSQETHYVSVTKPNRLILFRETVAVYCENHTEHTDI